MTGPDFPGSQLGATKTLTGLNVQITSYVGATSDAVSVCYFAPYTTQPAQCVYNLAAGTNNNIAAFNNYFFGQGASVRIMHNMTGSPHARLNPVGTETVTYNYSY
ncbi:hypothetical protein AB1286_02490 [Trinickia sp. NRRL B-1857]|uniref:hypothetical protein n=1 Tax=Trinickia sp. NRRL B-1857 TaxID=3162879 RepID=UPI003D2A5255